ncbi:MAG: LacI family DNA-binding transcriptional regulator [Lachnospiraceae bacterium]|nr:LacI family DNA-binding transcriptional regulator [Lachnospiraceae bacterium]MDO5550948.1 LacI family DNA-binding transcriptional regulator [Lachnospiraceae bacterium]
MATIKEIAELAGVSTTTVSNVIHGKTKKVSPATIQKIDTLIKELGYVQKMGLRVLANESSQLIGVIINSHKEFKDSILGDPFYGRILGFIEQYVQTLGYYVMFYSAKEIDQIFQMVIGWNIDGVIAISFSRKNCEKIYQLIKKPMVSIDAYGELEEEESRQVLNIGLDDVSGGYMMTKYLLECGYQHIKVCAGRDGGVDHLRFLGAQKAADEWGNKSQKLQFVPLGMNWTKRKENYGWLMKRKQPETVLFFVSDLYALEAISFFSSHGLSIPKDIGIAGYDDISFAQISAPRLTTVRQDVEKKAQMAVEMLMKQIHGQEIGREMDRKLPVTLMVRESTRIQR